MIPPHSPGLQGLWRFDGDNEGAGVALDASGNGKNGTLIGGATYANGGLGRCLNLSVAGVKYVNCTPSPVSGSNPFTLFARQYSTANVNYSRSLCIGRNVNSENAGIGQHSTTGRIGAQLPTTYIDSGIDGSDGWHTVMLSYAGGALGNVKLYVDGLQFGGTRTRTLNISTVLNTCSIGAFGAGAFNYKGYIDEAAIWGRELTAADAWRLRLGLGPIL